MTELPQDIVVANGRLMRRIPKLDYGNEFTVVDGVLFRRIPKVIQGIEYSLIEGELCKPLGSESWVTVDHSNYPLEVLRDPDSLNLNDFYEIKENTLYRKDAPYHKNHAGTRVKARDIKFCGVRIYPGELKAEILKENSND